MKLLFEEWMLDQELSTEAESLFAEATACYRAEAYRAAFIMSYLAFLTVLRDRALVASPPTGSTEEAWARRLEQLRDPEGWDPAVVNMTQARTNGVVFRISDQLRRQVTYFKDRRNDCAHGKVTGVGYELVETFWTFLRNHLARFVIDGGEAALVERIRDHFDPSLTAPSAPLDPLVREVTIVVEPTRYSTFVRAIVDALGRRNSDGVLVPATRTNVLATLEALIALDVQGVSEAVYEVLQREKLESSFLRRYPHRVVLLARDARNVRQLWFSNQLAADPQGVKLYAALLRNDLIPEDERDESLRHFVRHLPGNLPDTEDVKVIEEAGFWSIFEAEVFQIPTRDSSGPDYISNFDWANRNRKLVARFLEERGFTDRAARAITRAFAVPHFPWHAATELDSYLEDHPGALSEYLDACERLDLDPSNSGLETVRTSVAARSVTPQPAEGSISTLDLSDSDPSAPPEE